MSAASAAVRRLGAVGAAAPRRALAAPGRAVLAVPVHTRRRAVILTLVAAVLVALYLLVLRDVGLVAVDRVAVTGLTGKDAARAAAAFEQAGRESTTLHVDHAAIDEVTTRFPTIESVRVDTDFPTGMRISVSEQRPAAMLVFGARRIPVARDGSVLTGLPVRESLPEVKIKAPDVPAKKLTPSGTLDAVRVAGGAPAALTPVLERVTRSELKGWVVQVRDGPQLIFGPARRLAGKWAAATRVLADRDAAGADYVDLRIPGRPAAGGLPVQTMQPVVPADSQDGASPATPIAPTAPRTIAPASPAGPARPPASATRSPDPAVEGPQR